jgi:protein-tyrosine phosphatase
MTTALEGLVNFRDLGGTPVASGGAIRPGVLFRSDSLAYATPVDVRRLLDEYRLATVVDLRSDIEIGLAGRGHMADTPTRYRRAPIVDVSDTGTRAAHYLAILAERGDRVAAVVRLLGEAGTLPALVHCEIGCDRTGVVVATVLGLAGVADKDICVDYALTAGAMEALADRGVRLRAERGLQPRDRGEFLTWLPSVEVMEETLDLIRSEWGGLDGWAQAHGLSTGDVERLRAALVDPA